MKPPIDLLPGERVLYRSVRGGATGDPPWVWLPVFGGAFYLLTALMFSSLITGRRDLTFVENLFLRGVPLGIVALSVAFQLRLLDLQRRASYLVTDRRIIARRFLDEPLILAPADVALARRFLITYTRYGQAVSENLTHMVVIVLRSGMVHRIGPVEEPDGFVDLLNGIAGGSVDLRALPGVDGELAAAEARTDLYFARATLAGVLERGPLFIGPGRLIAFTHALTRAQQLHLFTVAGAERSAEEIEQTMLTLSDDEAFGRSVVMKREGATLLLAGNRIALSSDAREVSFSLSPEDARRAERLIKDQPHPYR